MHHHDVAEVIREPAELVAQGRRPGLVDERPERAQIGTEPAGGDARLVHSLGVSIEAHDQGRDG